jgi:Histidine kinase-, DNA gyrase B-, and HSP90-like ATPase
VNDLPLNGRNFTQLLTLTPGVGPVSVAQNPAGGSGWGGLAVGTFTFPAVNGQRNRSNMFLLDGVNDLAFLGNYKYAPIIDDIQEFKVQSHNDLAEFGAVAGGIINVVTKSGTNAFHGSAWEFLRNEQMDARYFFLPTRNPLRQNQFGLAAGGPVLFPHLYNGRNQTFFFFAYEGFCQSQEAQSIVRVPTTAQLTGDFSSLLSQGIQIYNPFSTSPDPLHRLQRELVDLNEVIREMMLLLHSEATQFAVLVRTELTADLPPVTGDRVQLQQVLMNLMMNSIDAMKDVDGTRELTIQSQCDENGQVLISVSDTGVGLPPQQADKIFNAFFTTKTHGTGMGLRISRSIIESNGGRLWAADNPPPGARFCFTLPTGGETRDSVVSGDRTEAGDGLHANNRSFESMNAGRPTQRE